MRNDESATALAAEGLVAVCLARTSSVERVAVSPATPALRTTKRSRGQQQRRAKEAKLPAEKRAALPAVPSFVQPVRAASPETAAAKFREEQKRLKRVRVLFSREELDYGAARHVRRGADQGAAGAAEEEAGRGRRHGRPRAATRCVHPCKVRRPPTARPHRWMGCPPRFPCVRFSAEAVVVLRQTCKTLRDAINRADVQAARQGMQLTVVPGEGVRTLEPEPLPGPQETSAERRKRKEREREKGRVRSRAKVPGRSRGRPPNSVVRAGGAARRKAKGPACSA